MTVSREQPRYAANAVDEMPWIKRRFSYKE
jgi:hypothetical protein